MGGARKFLCAPCRSRAALCKPNAALRKVLNDNKKMLFETFATGEFDTDEHGYPYELVDVDKTDDGGLKVRSNMLFIQGMFHKYEVRTFYFECIPLMFKVFFSAFAILFSG